MSRLVFDGPAEFEMQVYVISDDGQQGKATIGLGTFEFPTKEKIAERIAEFETKEMPKGFRLMTKSEAWKMVMYEKTGTTIAMPGGVEWGAT
jgi:hypothetical protein